MPHPEHPIVRAFRRARGWSKAELRARRRERRREELRRVCAVFFDPPLPENCDFVAIVDGQLVATPNAARWMERLAQEEVPCPHP